jgi:AAA domain
MTIYLEIWVSFLEINMKKMNLLMESWRRFLNEAEEQSSNKKIFVLVGPPSAGKSHWINKTFGGPENVYVISRDDIVTSVAKKYGWTYDDMFTPPAKDAKLGDADPKFGEVIKSPDYMTWQPLSLSKVLQANNEVQTLFTQRVSSASQSDKPIVVDMTNMNVGARKGALKAIEGKEKDYEKIAVIFKFQGAEQIIKRIAQKRAEEYKARGEPKTIPPEALERMFKAYQQVTSEEGFDKIIDVDNTKELSKLVSSDNGPEQRVNEDKIKVNKNYLKNMENKVKITKQDLKLIIKEEMQKVLKEEDVVAKALGLTHGYNPEQFIQAATNLINTKDPQEFEKLKSISNELEKRILNLTQKLNNDSASRDALKKLRMDLLSATSERDAKRLQFIQDRRKEFRDKS